MIFVNLQRLFTRKNSSLRPKYITTKVLQSCNNADILVVEPNVSEHKVFKLADYAEAYEKADIVVFLVAHKEFKTLPYRDDKVILDFCGIYKKN